MTDDQMDVVFAALASAARRRILDLLKNAPGSNVNQIAAHFDVSRIQVMKHLRALEAADLVISRRVGRERHLYLNVVPIQLIHDRWTTEFSELWAGQLVSLKFAIENDPAIAAMNREADAAEAAETAGMPGRSRMFRDVASPPPRGERPRSPAGQPAARGRDPDPAPRPVAATPTDRPQRPRKTPHP
jgi:DNA-binding transcriptional ArsR family regulator